MPHTPEHRGDLITRNTVLQMRSAGQIDAATARRLLAALQAKSQAGEREALSEAEFQTIVGGGQIQPAQQAGIAERLFGGVGTPQPTGLLTRGDIQVPLPGEETLDINLPLLTGGITLGSLGIGGPAGATGLGLSRAGTLGAARTAAPVVGGRAVRAGLAGAGTGILGGTIGAALQPDVPGLPPPPTEPPPTGPEEDPEALADAADDLDGDVVNTSAGALIRRPVVDDEGNPIPNQFTYHFQDGSFADPAIVAEIDPEGARKQEAFRNTPRGLVFQAELQRRATERQQRFVLQRRAADLAEAERQRIFQAEQAQAQRELALTQALLPILASPGSRFRFTANIGRLGGGDPTFTPTETLGRIFQFTGFEPSGQPVPLTGQQVPSLIPNVQEFAGLSPLALEELGAIVEQTTGQDIGQVQRQARRALPIG